MAQNREASQQMKKEQLVSDLAPFNVNGVVHIGAGQGELARYYHRLGVHKVMWVDKNFQRYAQIYDNTKNFGMKQDIFTFDILGEGDNSFLSLWRKNAAFIDIYSFDMINIAVKANHVEILKGFSFLLDSFKLVVFSNIESITEEQEMSLRRFMDDKGYSIDQFSDSELVFTRRG